MAKKTEVVKKTKKKTATTGEKPVVKTAQTKSAVTREPAATAKAPVISKPGNAASNKPLTADDKNYAVVGKVTYPDTTPATGLTVIAYDKDVSGQETLGQPVVTNESGAFAIPYSDSDFRRTKKERGGADVIVCVYNAKQELLFTSKKKNSAPSKYELKITVPAQPFVVRGKVHFADGTPLAGALVRAYDKDLRSEEPLGKPTTTDKDGRYEITYTAKEFSRAEKLNADLIVRVSDAGGTEPTASSIHFNARPEETVDLVVGGVVRGPSEYERLLVTLTPLLQDIPLAELKEDETHQDFTFLAGETGFDPQHITWLAQAANLERDTREIPGALFYGLFRQGLSAQLNGLFLVNLTSLKSALDRAIQDNIIPGYLRVKIPTYLKTFDQLRLARQQKPSTDPAHPTLKDRFGDLFADEKLLTLAKADANHPTFSKEWELSIKEAGFNAKDISSIQTTYLLGGLTRNNHALGQTLNRKYKLEAPSDLRKLVSLDRAEWDSLATQHGIEAEQRDLYVKDIVTALEVSFSGAVMARELEKNQLDVPEHVRPILKRFFKNNPAFEFDALNDTPFLSDGGDANLTGIESEQIPLVKEEILRLDRVRKLIPRSSDFGLVTSANALLTNNFDSAHRIVSIGQRDFVAGIKDHLPGGEAAALRFFDQANHNSMLAQVLVSEHANNLSTPIAILSNTSPASKAADTIQIPDLATLFGNQDFCNCTHCKSVYSPAAYFVDLLKFLWNRRPLNPTLKEILFSRRPDLGEIELTCENTNTPLLYVDLVTEILEEAVSPLPIFTPTTLPVGSVIALDNRNVPQLKLINTAPPLTTATPLAALSDDAQIEVVKRGELWTIDEPAFSYTIRAESGSVKLVARGRQTKGSNAERAAQPQYTHEPAYHTLRKQVFPWSLPFDLSLQMADTYLQHFEVTRRQILETFSSGERNDVLNSLQYACSELAMGIDEARIITGQTTGQADATTPGPWNFWGFARSNGVIPNPTNNSGTLGGTGSIWFEVVGGRIDALLQQSNLTYRELLELLDTYFINPLATTTARQLSVISTDATSAETCETDKLKLEGFNEDTAIRFVRFVRLWRKLGWTMRDLDRAITAFMPPLGARAASPGDISANELFLIKLAQIHRLHRELNIPVSRLLSWGSARGTVDTKQYRDYTDNAPVNSPSVYEQLFRSRSISNAPSTVFVEDPALLTGQLSAHYGAIASALSLSLQDLTQLAKHIKVLPDLGTTPLLDNNLNLVNLSRLYRHALLARTLSLSIRDYLVLLELSEIQPFVSLADSIVFVERVRLVQEAGISAAQLSDLLLPPASGSIATKQMEERAVDVLEDLRRNLRPISEEYDALDPANDTQGDLLRRKLALLNWNSSLVDGVIATLSGTLMYEEFLGALPGNLVLPNSDGPISVDLTLPQGVTVTIPTALREKISYNATTNKLVASGFLNASERVLLSNAATDVTVTTAINNLFAEQDAFEGDIRYDAVKQVLRFVGPMTAARKARLDAAPNGNQTYLDAVRALFDAPRRFLKRHMLTFTLRKFSVNLPDLPTSVKFTGALKDKIYFNNTTQPSQLHIVGAMTSAERDVLRALSVSASDPNDPYIAAIDILFAQADIPIPVTSSFDTFLTTEGTGNHASALFDLTTTAGKRFELVLTELLPYLRRKLSEDSATRRVAEAFPLDTVAAEDLLQRWLVHPNDRTITTPKRNAMSALLDPLFMNSHPEVKLTAQGFGAQFKTVLLLQKVADIIARFKATPRELQWLFTYGPSVGWLNLNSLPLTDTDAVVSLRSLLRVVDLFKLRDRLSNGSTVLDELFAMARNSGQISTLLERVSKLTDWPLDDLMELAGPQGLKLLDLTNPNPNNFQHEQAMARLWECFRLLKRLGMTAKQCNSLAQEVLVSATSANDVVRAARAKYDEVRWLEIARPLRDPIREKQRSALVAYLVNRPDATSDQNWRDVGDLYAHFLIDVEMSPCQMTSRIKQAISSVQLFVQRCLMNLEQGAHSNVIDLSMWKWMKNYRVWEANRKVFLYPENWIEPDLREDKTPLFRDLESQLQQGDATPEVVEKALLGYLDKLDQVARLEVVASYNHIKDSVKKTSDLYVFARTFNQPHVYFYRRWVDGSYWTAWEQVDVDIEGDHLVPVVWMDQLYLFWLQFTEKATTPTFELKLDTTVREPQKYWDVQIAYSEFKSGKWSAKQLIELENPLGGQKIPKTTEQFTKKEQYSLAVFPSDSVLKLFFGAPEQSGNVMAFFWQQVIREGKQGRFDKSLRVSFNVTPAPFRRSAVSNAELRSHRFRENRSSGQLPLAMFLAERDANNQIKRQTGTLATVLTRNPLKPANAFEIVLATQPDVFIFAEPSIFLEHVAQDPFFYQDNIRSYFASPESTFDIVGYIGAFLRAVFLNSSAAPDPKGFFYQTAHFWTFYHPYVQAFRETLIKGGLEAFLSLENQKKTDSGTATVVYRGFTQSAPVEAGATFLNEYKPTEHVHPFDYPKEIVDFSARGAYSQYNWELFFHAPFLIATRLSKNQRFEEAQRWFHFIFDPTTDSTDAAPQRYWNVKPFYDAGQGSSIQRLMKILADKTNISEEKKNLQTAVSQWQDNPFRPHAVARWRPRAYQLTVVMKYLDNLVAWGDQLFRRDTIETLNEATQLYILAAELLGRRPRSIPPRAVPQKHTFNSLAPTPEALDSLGNALVAVEQFIAPSAPPAGAGNQQVHPLTMLYFCVPHNDKLLGYWDLVEDRLFKIRHCMNIEGVTRQLPLFEPPIDPALLVKAAAAGIDLTSALNDISAALPPYRFSVLSQKATELCSEVKGLGASLLSALEKRDAEAMSLLRAKHELAVLEMVLAVKGYQVEEAQASLDALTKTLGMAQTRLAYYLKHLAALENVTIPQRSSQDQLDRLFAAAVDIVESLDHNISPTKALTQLSLTVIQEVRNSLKEFDRVISGESAPIAQQDEKVTLPMNRFEKRQLDELKSSNEKQLSAMDAEALALVLGLIPDIKIGAPTTMGASFGGTQLATIARVRASQKNFEANEHAYRAGLHSILGGYQRRYDEWLHQSDLILGEMEQIGKQLVAGCMRLAIAVQEKKNHEKQIQNAREADEFMRDKYTNQELYDWMAGQISVAYFQAYQLAYDVAKRAEKAYRFELGVEDSNFIQFGYWDSLKKGLLAGEKLSHDLKRLEVAYLDQNKREYEITKHISLLSLDPIALIKLRETGQCEIAIPEALFDLDYPGHYLRRIKTVSLTIPCVTGPYTGVNCTLTLLKSSVRRRVGVSGGYARNDTSGSDPRFSDNFGAIQTVATSSGQNDSGLFETNLRDERYLPFEGTGVISGWRLEMPNIFRAFDYETITDVVLHMRYTARDGGGALRQQATMELSEAVNAIVQSAGEQGLARVFSLRHEFPTEWHRFTNANAGGVTARTQGFAITKDRFPLIFSGNTVTISELDLYAVPKSGSSPTAFPPTLTVAQPGGAIDMVAGAKIERLLAKTNNKSTPLAVEVTAQKETAQWSISIPNADIDSFRDTFDDLLFVCHFRVAP